MTASTAGFATVLYGLLLVMVPAVLAMTALVVGFAGLRFLFRELAAPADAEPDRRPTTSETD